MSNADRIEELRSKYEENPRRYFAPLANEYRKAGDLAQAIAICREHLPKQPGHMSGYIVFGQTLFEAQSLDEARSVFEQALTLDPENLIALKHLGDIARIKGENGVARRWYARVLDADPRNDDIASQLAALGTPTPVMAIPAIPAPPAYDERAQDEAVGVFATFDPSSLLDVPSDVAGIAGGNEFWAPTPETRAPLHHEPLDLDFPDSPEPEAQAELDEAEFEEGIIAPEWPDTADLVARVVTPFRSATPISVPAVPEAMEAFGRVPTDPVEQAPVDAAPSDELVDAFMPPEVTASSPVDEMPSVDAAESLLEFSTAEFAVPTVESLDGVDSGFSGADDVPPVESLVGEVRSETDEAVAVESLVQIDEPETFETVEASTEATFAVPDAVEASDNVEPKVEAPVEFAAQAFVGSTPSWIDANEELPVFASDETSVEIEGESGIEIESELADDITLDADLIDESLIGESFEIPAIAGAEYAEPISVGTFEPVDAFDSDDFGTEARFEEIEVASAEVTADEVIPALNADVVVAEERPGTVEWAEPESVPVAAEAHAEPVDDDDVSFAAGLPWDRALSAGDLAETAEFPVQMAMRNGAHDVVDQAESSVFEETSHEAVLREPAALDSSLSVPEESFAAISSELETERAFEELDGADVAAEAESDIATDVAFDTAPQAVVGEASFADAAFAEANVADTVFESPATVVEAPVEEVFAEVVTEETPAFEPAVAVAAQAKPPEEKAPTFVTETMAELLISQGFHSRAIEVYEELVRRRPHDPVLTSRLAELREIEQAEVERAVAAASVPTPRFNTPLSNTPLSNTPLPGTPIANHAIAPTPLYNTPISNTPIRNAPVYITPHSATPVASAPVAATPLSITPLSATPIVIPAVAQQTFAERFANERAQAFRTAREKFAELSRRRVARRTPTHATAVSEDPTDGLASLFGTTAPASTDELAARALADAFGPVPDSGESLFDPAPTPTPAMPIRALTPRANSIIPSATNVDARSDRQPSADYSFDKFFPDPAMASREPTSSTTFASPPSGSQPVNEDLAQFSAWLKGLNNT